MKLSVCRPFIPDSCIPTTSNAPLTSHIPVLLSDRLVFTGIYFSLRQISLDKKGMAATMELWPPPGPGVLFSGWDSPVQRLVFRDPRQAAVVYAAHPSRDAKFRDT